MDLKLIIPSASKWVQDVAFLVSFETTWKNDWYSSSSIVSFDRVHIGGLVFSWSHSKVVKNRSCEMEAISHEDNGE